MKKYAVSAVLALLLASGCSTAVDLNPVNWFTGENHLAKRAHAATGKIKVLGKSRQQLLDLLGQPEKTSLVSKEGVEHWDFIYYDPPKKEISGAKKVLSITLTHQRVSAVASPDWADSSAPV